MKLRLVDERDGALGEVEVDPRKREPTLLHKGTDGKLGQFQASHEEEGAFVYRRVAVEREH
jgi:hypothetical protein